MCSVPGLYPKESIDPRTLEVLERFNIPTQGLRSKSISEFEDETFDFVITLRGRAKKECSHFPNAGK